MIAVRTALVSCAAFRPSRDDDAIHLDRLLDGPAWRERNVAGRIVAVGLDDVPVGHVAWGVASTAVTQSLQEPMVGPSQIDGGVLEVVDLVVDPCHRGLGIGGLLLDAAMTAVRHADCAPVIACGMDDAPAFLLCHSRGFIIRGRLIIASAGGFYSMVGDPRC